MAAHPSADGALGRRPRGDPWLVEDQSDWGCDGKKRSFDTLVHELTHHSMGNKWSNLPVWVIEGIADYMAAMSAKDAKFREGSRRFFKWGELLVDS